MSIDAELLKKLLGSHRVEPERCALEVWEKGEQVLRLAGPSMWMIEGYVRAASEKAGIPIDWHFAGGRAVVLALPKDKDKAREVLAELMSTFQEAARQAVVRGDADAFEVQICHWGGVRPPKPEEFPPGAIGWDPALGAFMFGQEGPHDSVKR